MLRNRSCAIYVRMFDAELMEVSTAVCMCCTQQPLHVCILGNCRSMCSCIRRRRSSCCLTWSTPWSPSTSPTARTGTVKDNMHTTSSRMFPFCLCHLSMYWCPGLHYTALCACARVLCVCVCVLHCRVFMCSCYSC